MNSCKVSPSTKTPSPFRKAVSKSRIRFVALFVLLATVATAGFAATSSASSYDKLFAHGPLKHFGSGIGYVRQAFFGTPAAPRPLQDTGITEDPTPTPTPPGPAISTDKTGYLTGETVTITGYGFSQSETITLQVRHADGTAEAGSGHESWSVS